MVASQAPGLEEALTGLGEKDYATPSMETPISPTASVRTMHTTEKHKKHGMNVQVIARPGLHTAWFSRVTPGRTHDLTSARAHGIVQARLTRQILVLADRAYQGAGATLL